MFAVIRTGGKQYKVAKDDVIAVESLGGEPGSVVEIGDVLMIGGDEAPTIGAPVIEKAAVFAEILDQTRGGKIIVFKKKRRKGYQRKAGHRQNLTVLRILGISPTGEKPKAGAKEKPAAKAPAAAEKPAEPEAKAEAEPEKQAKPAAKTKETKPAEPAAKTKEAKPAKPAVKKKTGTAAKGEAATAGKKGAKTPGKAKE